MSHVTIGVVINDIIALSQRPIEKEKYFFTKDDLSTLSPTYSVTVPNIAVVAQGGYSKNLQLAE